MVSKDGTIFSIESITHVSVVLVSLEIVELIEGDSNLSSSCEFNKFFIFGIGQGKEFDSKSQKRWKYTRLIVIKEYLWEVRVEIE